MSCLCLLPERFYRSLALALAVVVFVVALSHGSSSETHPLEKPLQFLVLLLEVLGDWRAAGPCNKKNGKKQQPSNQTTSPLKASSPSSPQNHSETPNPELPRKEPTRPLLPHPLVGKITSFWPQWLRIPYCLCILPREGSSLPPLVFKILEAGIFCLRVSGIEELQAFIDEYIKLKSIPKPLVILLYHPSEQLLLYVLQHKDILAPKAFLIVIVDSHQWEHQYKQETRNLLETREKGENKDTKVILKGGRYFYRHCRVIQQLRKHIKPVDQEWIEYKISELGISIQISFQKKAIRLYGREIVLGEIELRIFICLLEQHGHLVTYEQIIREIWEDSPDTRYIRRLHTHISNLRRALGVDSNHPCLQTVRNRGYILDLNELVLEILMPRVAFCEEV